MHRMSYAVSRLVYNKRAILQTRNDLKYIYRKGQEWEELLGRLCHVGRDAGNVSPIRAIEVCGPLDALCFVS